MILNYAQYLQERQHWEDSFKAYEKGLALFTWPQVTGAMSCHAWGPVPGGGHVLGGAISSQRGSRRPTTHRRPKVAMLSHKLLEAPRPPPLMWERFGSPGAALRVPPPSAHRVLRAPPPSTSLL